jgi:DNA invertase Pin-like site-specific DNA recombinase/uncharacterized protein (UPF0335 family)
MFSLSKSPTPKPLAYSYIRWSSAIQTEGDSNRRQLEAAERYAAEHGLELVETMRDEGKSAYTGKNLSDGSALGTFIQAIDNGDIEPGSYLLVEAHDRLSRQEPAQALSTFLSIINKGIVVVTLQDGIEYRTGQMDMMKLFGSIIKMSVAHEESEKKRQRGKANWEGKRKKAIDDGIKLTGTCPSWLSLSKDRKSFIINEQKANIIRRMFQMSADGYGLYKIAKTFNQEKIPTLNGTKEWKYNNLQLQMTQRTLIGEYQPKKRLNNASERMPVGEPIRGYYPAIISEDMFYAHLSAIKRRRSVGKGRKGSKLTNIFAGLIKCDCCGGPMWTNKGRGHIYCNGIKNGSCDSRQWSYNRFEQAMLSFVNEIDLESVINGGTNSKLSELTTQIDRLEGEKADIQSKVNRLLTLFEHNDFAIDMASDRLNGYQKALNELNERIEKLNDERLSVQEDNRIAGMNGDKKIFKFPDDVSEQELYGLRAKAAEHIRSIIEEIRLVRVQGTIQGRLEKAGDIRMANAYKDGIDKDGIDTRITVRFRGGATRVFFPISNDPTKAFKVIDMGGNNPPMSNEPVLKAG